MITILNWEISLFWIAAMLFLGSIKKNSNKKILIKKIEIYCFCFLGLLIFYISNFFVFYLFY